LCRILVLYTLVKVEDQQDGDIVNDVIDYVLCSVLCIVKCL